jgi:hypothetical protein
VPGDGETDDADGSTGDETGGDDSPYACEEWNLDPGPPPGFPGPTGGDVVFVDVTVEAGLVYRQYFKASGSRQECLFDLDSEDGILPNADCEPTWFTGGATAGDYDGDGRVDIFVTRLGAPDMLWHNEGDGTFSDRALEAGLGDCRFTNGAIFADIDRDGDPDLLVSGMGATRHYLFVNQGDGTFSEEATARGLDLPVDGLHSGESFGVGDYDQDGWLDVHVDEWLRTYHYPAGGTFGPRLLHNRGDGTFEDVTGPAGVSMVDSSDKGMFGFSSTFVDLDDDGWLDLAVAADFRSSRLFWNEGDGTFTNGTVVANVNRESNAMGSTFGDFDGDGRLDWFVTSIAELDAVCDGDPECDEWKGTGNRLYHNEGHRTFSESSVAAGVRDGAWAWGASFFDFDNDGDQDVVQANGWPGRDLNGGLYHQNTPMRLWQNDGNGVMQEIAEERGLTNRDQGRAVLVLDFDDDGDQDVFVANHAGWPALYRNDGGNDADWLRVHVRGTSSNLEGRGATVRVQASEGGPVQVRQIGVRSHFLGEGELTAHFGLGVDAPPVHEVVVRFPATGTERVFEDVDPNQTLDVTE